MRDGTNGQPVPTTSEYTADPHEPMRQAVNPLLFGAIVLMIVAGVLLLSVVILNALPVPSAATIGPTVPCAVNTMPGMTMIGSCTPTPGAWQRLLVLSLSQAMQEVS